MAEVPSAEQPSDVETLEVEVTQQAFTPAPQQPEEQAATVSPPGDIAPKPGLTVPDATTIGRANRPARFDAWYRAWDFRDIAVDEPQPLDEVPSGDSRSTTAEVSSAQQPSGNETLEVEVTQQASTPAPQQPEEQAATVSPPGDIAPKPGPTVPETTTVGEAHKPENLDVRYRAWNFRDIAADEPEPVDEVPSSGDSCSTTAEVSSAQQPSGNETLEVEGTQQAPSRAPQQPEDHAATVSPSVDSASTHAGSAVPKTMTVSEAHKPGKLDVRYRPWTLGAAELAAEEAEPSEAAPADENPSPTAAPETRSAGQMSGAETPHVQVSWQAPASRQSGEQGATVSPSGYGSPTSAASTFTSSAQSLGETKQSRRRLRISPTWLGVLALVFLLTTLGTGFVALKQSSQRVNGVSTITAQPRSISRYLHVMACSQGIWHRLARRSRSSSPRRRH